MSHARPSARKTQIPYQFMSNSYQVIPCRADCGTAWGLLCPPSPKGRRATHRLFLEVSSVKNRRDPHMCVAEFTSQVACRPTTVRKNTPHNRKGQPPIAKSAMPSTVSGTQCHLVIQR